MDFISLGQIRDGSLLQQGRTIYAFSSASIRRLVFFVIARSVYQTERPS
jgi:hypothetical protein